MDNPKVSVRPESDWYWNLSFWPLITSSTPARCSLSPSISSSIIFTASLSLSFSQTLLPSVEKNTLFKSCERLLIRNGFMRLERARTKTSEAFWNSRPQKIGHYLKHVGGGEEKWSWRARVSLVSALWHLTNWIMGKWGLGLLTGGHCAISLCTTFRRSWEWIELIRQPVRSLNYSRRPPDSLSYAARRSENKKG